MARTVTKISLLFVTMTSVALLAPAASKAAETGQSVIARYSCYARPFARRHLVTVERKIDLPVLRSPDRVRSVDFPSFPAYRNGAYRRVAYRNPLAADLVLEALDSGRYETIVEVDNFARFSEFPNCDREGGQICIGGACNVGRILIRPLDEPNFELPADAFGDRLELARNLRRRPNLAPNTALVALTKPQRLSPIAANAAIRAKMQDLGIAADGIPADSRIIDLATELQ